MPKKKEIEGEVVETKALQNVEHDVNIKAISPSQLQRMVESETEKRKILRTYIGANLTEGQDYGKIHIGKDCLKKYDCDNPYHFSKDTLFKSGSEKFTSLFQLRPIFEQDKDSWEMAGSQSGTFFYVCKLTDKFGNIIAEGRGACSIQEKGNANTAIKIAQKRAQTDAVLRQGAISDFFTQDMEDLPPDERTPARLSTPPMQGGGGGTAVPKFKTEGTVEVSGTSGRTEPNELDKALDGDVVPKPLNKLDPDNGDTRKTCPYCGNSHTGGYPKCLDCWRAERKGKVLEPLATTKKVINPNAPPFEG